MIDTRINDMYIINDNNLNNDKYVDESYLKYIINNHIEIINSLNHYLWKDDNNNLYYKKFNGKKVSGTKEQISDIISEDIKRDILIVDDIYSSRNLTNKTGIYGNTYQYILINLIPYKVFNPFTNLQTYYDISLQKYFTNLFRYSDYLEPRLSYKEHYTHINANLQNNYSESFINKFIFNLVTNEDDYNTIINWLSGFFKTLVKSDTALVLVGDKEVSQEIFLDQIIKPIFGHDFCTTITAKMIKEQSIHQIIEDNIFYHIDTLPNFTAISKQTQKLLNEIVTKNIATREDIDQSDTHIFGQTLITSINLNHHLIESIKDNCKVVKINDFKTIIEELGCTKASFYREVEKDLRTFSSFLLNFQLDKELSDKLDTKARVPVLPWEDRIFKFKDFWIDKNDNRILSKSLSDGEHQFLHTIGLALLYKNTPSLFLLDEPETHFNPAWRAKYISTLKKCFKNDSVSPEVLITSHSPFLVSDSHPDNVLIFEKDEQNKVSCKRANFNTFGASINKITIKVFEKSETIGDMAKSKLEEYKQRIENEPDIDSLIDEVEYTLGDSVEKILLLKELFDKREGK